MNYFKMSFLYMTWHVAVFYVTRSILKIEICICLYKRFNFDRLYGYTQGVIAVGAVLGGVAAGVLSEKLKSTTSPLFIAGCALSVLLGGMALQILREPIHIYIVLITSCGLLVALSTIFQIRIMSCIQILTPKELIGKVISCDICICMCTMPLGQFIYGFVFEKIENGTYYQFYLAALIMIGISIFTRRIFNEMDRLLSNDY